MQWTENTVQDLRFALRGWRRTPGFAIAAIATLALGIGANTAIFSVVSGVLLRPLPFPHPNRLAQLYETSPAEPRLPLLYVVYRDLENWRANAASFQGMATYSSYSQNLQDAAETEQVATTRAERSLFGVLGVGAMLGRTFAEGDPPDVVVVSAGFWRRHFGGDRSAIGRKLTLDGQFFTVIGVMPEEFQFPYRSSRTELWTPWSMPQNLNPNARLDAVVGRLKPGIAVETARNELSVLSGRMAPGRSAVVTPLADVVGGPVRNSLLVLLGAVGLVLLVACANVANLLLARAAARSREVAIRMAVGAGRWRLIRQFLAESLLLALSGGLIGLGIGKWGSSLLVELAGAQIPRAWEIGFDWRVFAFLLAMCLVTGVGFGIAPAIGAARGDVLRSLKPGERGSAARGRLRDGLVVAEVALAFVLLAGAGLLLRTFLNLQSTPTGLQAENVLTLHMVVAGADESRALEERVSQIPGVRAAGFISLLPLQNSNWNGRFTVTGRPGEGGAEFRYVTPGYFRTMGIPLLRGRGLSDRDTSAAPKVLLINEAFARQYFPNEDPVGQVLTGRGTIVGVVGDVRQARLDRPAVAEIYYPVAQNFAQIRSLGSTMLVSGHLPPESLVSAVRRAIREVNPKQAVFRVQTMEGVIADSLATQRLYLWLLGLFAALGTLLAAAGIYGVIAYLVTLRTQEFGIRMALGADAGRVLRLVMGRGGLLVSLGLAIGLGGAAALTRFLKTVLYGVTPTDPLTFGAMALLLAAAALSACLVPARRAARVDPAVALRSE
jgi:predicted permease